MKERQTRTGPINTLATHESQTTTEIWQNLQSTIHQGLQTAYPVAQTTKTQKMTTHMNTNNGEQKKKNKTSEKNKKEAINTEASRTTR